MVAWPQGDLITHFVHTADKTSPLRPAAQLSQKLVEKYKIKDTFIAIKADSTNTNTIYSLLSLEISENSINSEDRLDQ